MNLLRSCDSQARCQCWSSGARIILWFKHIGIRFKHFRIRAKHFRDPIRDQAMLLTQIRQNVINFYEDLYANILKKCW